jgi:hypothetical protein
MNIFDLLESPGMGRPRDTNGIQSAADQSANSVIGSGTTKRETKKKPVTMMGVGVKESVEEAVVKPNFKMPPESVQDKMYRQHQELRKQRGAPSAEEYKQRIAQKQAEIDALKESSYASDKNYKQANAYKNYNIYVGKNPFVKQSTGEKFYIAVTNIGKHEFKEKGVTQQEAVDAIQNKIDEILNAQQRVSASATLDFNVKFATDILGNPRESFYAKVINVGGEPKLIIAGKEMLDFGRELVGLGFKPSALRIDPDSETATALPSISYSSRQIKDTGLIANGRYEIGDMKTDNDGNRVFDLTYHSTAHTKSDKMRLNKPAVTVGTTRSAEVKEGILDRAIPKMPKPRNPADSVLQSKVNAGGRHLDKKRRQELAPKHKHKDPMAESLRPGERHHFETDPVTGKRVYKGIRGDQQDAPQRAKDDPAARADQERKAHIAHDRGLTEQAVKITDYDTWSDEVKALGGEIHTQRDRNLLVAQSWDGEEIGKFHLGKNMGFINQSGDLDETIRKMGSQYRLLSKKGKNLGTFDTKAGAEKHEREVQYFKHKNMEEGVEDSQEQHVAAMLNRRSRGPQVATHRTLFDLSDEHNSLPAGSTVRRVEGSKKLYVHLVDGSPKNVYRIDKNHVEPLDRTDEGWKGKLAGAALAGAAALGGGDVDAQNIDLPGPQVSYVAHVSAEANGREVHRTVNLGSNYSSEQEAYDDIERSLQAKGITRYNINIEQRYDAQYYPGSNQPRGGSATGRDYGTPGIGDMVIKHIGREIRAGIPDRGGYATGGTNQGQRPRDGSQWWRDQLPRIKEDELAEDVESHLYLMSRAGYDIVQEAWSDKYKDSINCSNPKGFSQKAHCAGKKKNEEVSEEKVRLDPKCWTGKKIGNPKTKMKGGVRVNNCVPK